MKARLRDHATDRNVVVLFLALCATLLVTRVLIIPVYQTFAAGFAPLDMQFPLTREMVAIQRGAMGPGVETVYLAFSLVDVATQWVTAIFFALFWLWITVKVPHPSFDRLLARGLLLVPFLAPICDVGENIGFAILVIANPHDPLHDITRATLLLHNVRVWLGDATMAITIVLIGFAAYFRRQRNRGRA
jgi:hypothetical protein